MTGATGTWYPPQRVRPVAIGLVRKDDRLLLMAVRDESGMLVGWRPLGGGIEFTEAASDALVREFREELGEEIEIGEPDFVMENLYRHNGKDGHEIVFVFEVRFSNPTAYGPERFAFCDGGTAVTAGWLPLDAFKAGRQTLFPDGLIDRL